MGLSIGGAIGGWGGGALAGIACEEAGPFDIACIAGGRYLGRAIGDGCEGAISQMANGGGRNGQKGNKARQDAAQQKLDEARAKRDNLSQKPNKTPDDKTALDKLNALVKHLTVKANEVSENHSMKGKGPGQ